MSATKMIKKIYALYILLLLFTGCATSINNISKPHIPLNYQDYPDSSPTSETVLLIADNQITEERNSPILENSSALAREKIVGRSVFRNGVVTEFSPAIVQNIISKHKDQLVIHVGDALNNSCVSEYELFETVMGDSTWFFTPGNHDGFYMGLTSPIGRRTIQLGGILNEPKGWSQVCRPYYQFIQEKDTQANIEDYSLNKKMFIQRYLESLGLNLSLGKFSKDGKQDNKLGRRKKYLNQAEWDISHDKEPWKNYIVQQLYVYSNSDEKKFAVIIIDTSSYSLQPNLFFHNGAADTAEIQETQGNTIQKWLEDLKEDENLPVIIIGHHPLDDFEQNSIEKIRDWYEKGLFQLYISGDVHDGYDVIHKKIKYKKNEYLKEFNLGSTIDTPIEYGTLTLKRDRSFETKRYFMTPFADKLHRKFNYPKNGISDDIWNDCNVLCNDSGMIKNIGSQAGKIKKTLDECTFCKFKTRFRLTKIRRYSEMFHAYKYIFDQSNHPKKQKILNLIEEALDCIEDNLNKDKIEGTDTLLIKLSCFLDGKKCNVTYENSKDGEWSFEEYGLKSLRESLLEIEDTPENKDLRKRIVCLALWFAEADYPE
jgi:hypothetical protein